MFVEEKLLNNFLKKKLVLGKKKLFSGRNNQGKVTMRHKGSQIGRIFRIINFHFYYWNIYGLILKFSYDPNRNNPLMLICYFNGLLSYHLATKNSKIGDLVFIGDLEKRSKITSNFTSFFYNFSEGLLLNNLELHLFKGSQIARAAGTAAQLLKIDIKNNNVLIRLPSKEERLLHCKCIGSIGQNANINHFLLEISTAGRNRYYGKRPCVRGVAMNPVDHPHGGGQGRTSGAGGYRSQVTFKSKVAKTQPTRLIKKKRGFIIKTRKK